MSCRIETERIIKALKDRVTELETELQKELQRRWDGNADASKEFVEQGREITRLEKENAELKAWQDERLGNPVPLSDWEKMEQERDSLAAIVQEVNCWAVCACIASAEDMAQNFPRIVEITSDPLVDSILKRRDAETLRNAANHFDHAIGLVAGDGKETLTAIELRRMAAENEREQY